MGLPRDLRIFGEMVQQAAAAGSADALFALGGVFFHGEDGFARDPRAAFRCVIATFVAFIRPWKRAGSVLSMRLCAWWSESANETPDDETLHLTHASAALSENLALPAPALFNVVLPPSLCCM